MSLRAASRTGLLCNSSRIFRRRIERRLRKSPDSVRFDEANLHTQILLPMPTNRFNRTVLPTPRNPTAM